MGWLYTDASNWKNGKIDRKAEMDSKINAIWSDGKQHNEVVKSSMKGSVYYGAIKTLETGEIWGLVCLTRTDKWDFGYKDMSEDMHPYYYDCPKSILDLLTPTENENANEWRRLCKEKRESKKGKNNPARLPEGTTIKFNMPFDSSHFNKGEEVTLTKTLLRQKWNGRKTYGWLYRGYLRMKQNWIPDNFTIVTSEA